MKSFKSVLPLAIIVLVEIAVAILLFIDPISFATWLIRIFGVAMMGVSLFYIIRFIYYKVKRMEANVIPMILSVLVLAAGIVCTFFADSLLAALSTVIALIFGIVMVIGGILKINTYIDTKRDGNSVSLLSLFSSIFSLLCGIAIIVLSLLVPVAVANFYLYAAGVVLLLQAIMDIVSIVFVIRIIRKEDLLKS